MKAPPWRRRLLAWYRGSARDLPWRTTRDPYRVWLSEVMLQQTRVETALPYYRRFLETLPDARSLAGAPESRVLKLWEGLGYYRRALHFRRAVGMIVRERGGAYPTDAAGWRELPGVGAYTAGALASILNRQRVPAVDGNVRRVLARMYLVEGSRDDAGAMREIDALARDLVPASAPGDFNQALMELGARVCTPRRPRCAVCPVEGDCAARAAGLTATIPGKRTAKTPPGRVVAAGLVEYDGRWLVVKRPADGLLAGLWEFPGTPVTGDEKPQRALERAIAGELGIGLRAGREVARVRHDYSHFTLTLRVYRCSLRKRGAPMSRAPRGARWVSRSGLRRLPLHGAMKKALAAITEA